MSNRVRPACFVLLIVCCLLSCTGCGKWRGIFGVDKCADIPSGAIPKPAGDTICDWETAHVSGAHADQLVLYRADFIGSTAELSPGAIERLSRLLAVNAFDTAPLIIEPSGDEVIDSARTDSAIETLASAGVVEPHVEVAFPSALGLSGPIAERTSIGIGRGRGGNGGGGGLGAPLSRPRAGGGFGSGLSGGVF